MSYYLPLPLVWSPNGPVPYEPVFPDLNVQSKSSSPWTCFQRHNPWSNVQLLSDGVIVVGGNVGGAALLGIYVHG